MKLIIAYINQFKLDEVVEALKESGVSGLTAVEAQGFGRQGGHTDTADRCEMNIPDRTQPRASITRS